MEQIGIQLDRETLSCSICLDLLKNPVTIPCGHSYCMSCIRRFWDDKSSHSCPQCRQSFSTRPHLVKSTMLAAVVEKLKNTGFHAAAASPADHCYAGAEVVACDVCTGRKRKASKSCLLCLVSYCEDHLLPHIQSPAFENHKLINPSKNLRENICSRHGEAMKVFCRSDQKCICCLCSVDEHKGHDTVSVAAERNAKQKELEKSQQKHRQSIFNKREEVKVLEQEVKAIIHSADQAVEDSEVVFNYLIFLIKKRHFDVKQQIRSQRGAEVTRVKNLQKKLQQEIVQMLLKDAELGQLSRTEDHCHFLKNYPSLSQLRGSESSVYIRPLRYFKDLTAAVSESREKVQQILRDMWTNISQTEVDVVLHQPKPQTRQDFLKYALNITLDPNTASTWLLLSDNSRKATVALKEQPYSHQPSRFDTPQVLSKESLTGRCYWEVQMTGRGIHVAVASRSIKRRGDRHTFGYNKKSWSLKCDDDGYTFLHNSVSLPISGPPCDRVGVLLDHSGGHLSFYRVFDSMTLIHRVRTTFTQPLRAGVMMDYYANKAEFIKLK